MKSLVSLLMLLNTVSYLSCNKMVDKSQTNVESKQNELPADRFSRSVDEVQVNFTQHSNGTDALVFVHGWSCDQNYWREQLDFFKSDYQVVTLDLGGHGKSSKGKRREWTIPSFANDVLSVVDSLKYKNIVLIGHSLGAMVVLEAGKTLSPDKTKIICVDYLKKPLAALPIDVVDQYMSPFHTDFEVSMKSFVNNMFDENSDTLIKDWVLNDMASAPAAVAIPASTDLASRDFTSTMNTVVDKDIPRYIINSDASPTDSKYYQDSLGFQIVVIPQTNHFLMLEKPHAFNTQLKTVIKSI